MPLTTRSTWKYLHGVYAAKNIYSLICLGTLCIILVPIFFIDQQRIHNISKTGSLGYTLRTSLVLKILSGVSIGSALPMLVDLILDKIFNIPNMIEIANFSLAQFVTIISAIIYLSTYDQYYVGYLFTCCFSMKLLVPAAVILHFLSNGVIATKWKMHKRIFLIPIVFLASARIFVSFNLLFPEYAFLQLMIVATFVIGALAFFYAQGYWLYSFWRHYQINSILDYKETEELSHLLGLLLFFVCYLIINIAFNNPTGWLNTSESILISYHSIQTVLIVWLTVLPGRLYRKMAEINESILRLKREFVRYVSHEIRSPLNVAVAGLEILKLELEAIGVSRPILDLLSDINFASNTAIEILNDMLQYEHIDSGIFKLDLAVVPLMNIFVARLEAYKYMASNKNISLRIEDFVRASEYFNISETDADVDGDVNAAVRASHTAVYSDLFENNSSIAVLYIDRFRVEQLLRNLVSNAIKFTPHDGLITMRFILTSVDAASPSLELIEKPVLKLEDEMVSKQVTGYLRIEIVDNGAGIALENQPRVFNEFAQFNRNTLQGGGGSGLGLWICRNLASLHGGGMHFHSDGEGLGSTFFVELPVYKKMNDPMDALTATEAIAPGSVTGHVESTTTEPIVVGLTSDEKKDDDDIEMGSVIAKKLRVLIVDDSAANRKIVKRVIERPDNVAIMGECDLMEADDGLTALDVMRREFATGAVIDLVLMDFIMIHMNGPEAAQKMRAEFGFNGPVIGITGNALPEDIAYFKDHGANSVITKPLTNAKLLDAIRLCRLL